MKQPPQRLVRVLIIIIAELFIRGVVTNNPAIVWIGLINLLFMTVLWRRLLINLFGLSQQTEQTIKKHTSSFLRQYGYVLLIVVSLRRSLFRLHYGFGGVNMFIMLLLFFIASSIDNRSRLKQGFFWGSQKITSKERLLLGSIVQVMLLLAYNWMVDHAFIYPVAIMSGLLLYTVGMEILRAETDIEWRKKPIWIVYCGVFILSLLRGVGTLLLSGGLLCSSCG